MSDAAVALSPERVLLLHLVVTAFLCGLIWIVQLVHYPLFDRVAPDGFIDFEAAHQQRITWIVAPAMLLEAFTAAWWLLVCWRSGDLVGFAVANALFVVALWASTALLSVPEHARLAAGFDPEAHRRLVDTNWVRTAVWSLRTVGLAALAWRATA